MTLSSGSKLGPYEILSGIGAGGMGEVYRARDTRLDRIVAVKVLSSTVSNVPTARERFDREARAISGLNHPHICTLYDVGHQNGIDFLVMEYLEGETLADRLRKGALPIQSVFRYAAEIADAMDKAHKLGVIHRDLKPANVILTSAGTKLLDFGLAKLRSDSALRPDYMSPVTRGSNLTEHGTLLGTVQYMSPEQLEGKDADTRSDIFAFGALVFEMATGRPAFEGKTHASLMGAILHLEPPPMSTLEPLSPLLFDHIIRKCLAKNPADRWQSARDLADELYWISSGQALVKPSPSSVATSTTARMFLWPAMSGVLAVALLALAIAQYSRGAPASPMDLRFQVVAPPNTILSPAPADLSVSPDGRSIVFGALNADGSQVLWLRPIDSLTARALAGTEEAFSPFWSPDSRQLAFFAHGQLRRIDVGGGAPVTISDVPDGRGGTWSRAGVIIFARNLAGPLYRVAAMGGTPLPATTLDQSQQESAHLWPKFLPDNQHYLYLAWSAQREKRQIRVGTLDGAPAKTILAAESNASFAPPNHLLFSSGGRLMGQVFDPDTITVSGEPFILSEDVWTNPATGRASFDVAGNGVLVYRNGINFSTTQLVQRDRAGGVLTRSGAPGGYSNPSISPNGKRLAIDLTDYQKGIRNIWTLELDRGGITSRLTLGSSNDSSPIWAQNGTQILFLSDLNNAPHSYSVYRTEFGNNAANEVLLKSDSIQDLLDWSDAQRAIIFETFTPKTKRDIGLFRLGAGNAPAPFLHSEFNEIQAQLSPDGQWLAYSSDESGRYEVYVQRFPAAGGKRQVSSGGGMQPRWNPNGKELFYLAGDRTLMAAAINTGSSFEVTTSKALFQTGVYGPSIVRSRNNYVVGANGDTFITNSVVDSRQPINVIVGWETP